MRVEPPGELLRRLKIGREECFQRVLTCLILDAPYPRWNSRSTPSRAGRRFLERLYALSFDAPWPGDDFLFVDELELLPRHDAEQGGAPDWAAIWADRIWMIELKTERGSHRASQVPSYFDLGHHRFPRHRVDLTYLTGPMPDHAFDPEPPDRYAHLRWAEVAGAVEDVWSSADGPAVEELLAGIEDLGLAPSVWRAKVTGVEEPVAERTDVASPPAAVVPPLADPVEEACRLARLTADDHAQRALKAWPSSLDELLSWRLEVRNRLAASPEGDPLRHVMPWLWREASTGRPMTEAGAATGYELRFSWYRTPRY